MSTENNIPEYSDAKSPLLSGIPRSGDLLVPEGYFQQLEDRLVDASTPDSSDFFARQEDLILFQIHHEGSPKDSEWDIPSDYFEKMTSSIEARIQINSDEKKAKVRSMRGIWWTAISAAAVAVLGYFFTQPKVQEESLFQAMMANTPITYDDMPYFATDDDYHELCLLAMDKLPEGEEWSIGVSDSTVVIESVDTNTVIADTLNNQEIKPSGPNEAPTWEELTDEEIMQYLLETGDDV